MEGVQCSVCSHLASVFCTDCEKRLCIYCNLALHVSFADRNHERLNLHAVPPHINCADHALLRPNPSTISSNCNQPLFGTLLSESHVDIPVKSVLRTKHASCSLSPNSSCSIDVAWKCLSDFSLEPLQAKLPMLFSKSTASGTRVLSFGDDESEARVTIEDALIDEDPVHHFHIFNRTVKRAENMPAIESQSIVCKLSCSTLDGTRQNQKFRESHPEADLDAETALSIEEVDEGCRIQLSARLEPTQAAEDYSDLQAGFNWLISESMIIIATALRDTLLNN